ncbi:hypothetical protein Htur_2523 [Haloterrigena turkmenica DSM 5511]|uniref:DUF7344 domain-containing protein n=1 Tax=Haloterrigena turkmenica (strain ATCC 51198 / DSM 5511 / JCM 9101 / NCIMB 13204 / VKM B-1734 / 4k) TaxID=543526 RepID=D2RVX1_HALTV|nr:hypothetical protein [Haloterrigena turkmenica]ADB61400.1 hypothetical protein Htur_2523 [Haloterrigena turkmenica DSM 5511]
MRETEGESTELTAQVTPSLDLIFELLSNRRRRYALYHLYDQPDGVATMDELTDAVVTHQYLESNADRETDDRTDADGALEGRRQQVRMDLQHTHLPKLEDAGVLEHDHRSEMVRYWNQPSLEEWLEHARHKELA